MWMIRCQLPFQVLPQPPPLRHVREKVTAAAVAGSRRAGLVAAMRARHERVANLVNIHVSAGRIDALVADPRIGLEGA
jgi:hypothetical protein